MHRKQVEEHTEMVKKLLELDIAKKIGMDSMSTLEKQRPESGLEAKVMKVADSGLNDFEDFRKLKL